MATTRATRGLRWAARISDDRAADRDACKRHVAEIEPLEKALDRLGEEGGVVTLLGNVRVAVPGIVQGIDRKMLRELRHDFLEQVELGAERVQEHERGSAASFDVAQPVAANLHGVDRDVGIPGELCRRLRYRPQRLDREGQEPDGDADAGKDDEKREDCVHGSTFLGIDRDVAAELGLAGEDVPFRLVFVGEGVLHRHVHAAGGELDAA